ncbi:hypothetical protein [Streptomyces sp. NPDC060198]|uniref:hypothetical protein n=1 Tax=Streptomyces sp. NPDC060198 TaxID=3347070 RepID=UPI00365CBD0F
MTTPLTPAPSAPSDTSLGARVRTSAASAIIGGLAGAVMSAAVVYFIIGMPDGEGTNALNNAISGLISGFLAGFIGLMVYQSKAAAAARAATAEAAATTTPAAATEAEAARPVAAEPEAATAEAASEEATGAKAPAGA